MSEPPLPLPPPVSAGSMSREELKAVRLATIENYRKAIHATLTFDKPSARGHPHQLWIVPPLEALDRDVLAICKSIGDVVDLSLGRSTNPSNFGHRRGGGFVWYAYQTHRNKALKGLPSLGIKAERPRWESMAPSTTDDRVLLQARQLGLPASLQASILGTFDVVEHKRYGLKASWWRCVGSRIMHEVVCPPPIHA